MSPPSAEKTYTLRMSQIGAVRMPHPSASIRAQQCLGAPPHPHLTPPPPRPPATPDTPSSSPSPKRQRPKKRRAPPPLNQEASWDDWDGEAYCRLVDLKTDPHLRPNWTYVARRVGFSVEQCKARWQELTPARDPHSPTKPYTRSSSLTFPACHPYPHFTGKHSSSKSQNRTSLLLLLLLLHATLHILQLWPLLYCSCAANQ